MRLYQSFGRKINIGPAGKTIFAVPFTLTMSQEYKFCHTSHSFSRIEFTLILLFCTIRTEATFQEGTMNHGIYDFTVKSATGDLIKLSDYQNKVLLIVNVASNCGFTPQYAGLEQLYQKYEKKGLVVIGFPCNQFSNQEPGSDKEIQNFCKLTYDITFPVFSKIDVNGTDAHPLYEYLKKALPGLLGIKSIKWNFTKFLIDRNGLPIHRFPPQTKPESIEDSIKKIL
jgi:glutathione peroxidase